MQNLDYNKSVAEARISEWIGSAVEHFYLDWLIGLDEAV